MLHFGICFAIKTEMKQIKFSPQYIIYNKFTGVGQNYDGLAGMRLITTRFFFLSALCCEIFVISDEKEYNDL
jgi:hypothetical protein